MNHFRRAFTLVEMLLVMAVIAVLASLILSAAGYAQRNAARSKAKVQLTAMEAALESYKAENGDYPPATADPASTASLNGQILYEVLTGDGDDQIGGSKAPTGTFGSAGKVYMELKPDMLVLDTNKKPISPWVRDPFGNGYRYRTPLANNPTSTNNPTYDLWSTGGRAGTTATDKANWITNW